MIFNDLESLKNVKGQEIGTTEWLTVSQEMINNFAKSTLDFQWIHLDAEKAAAFSPYGKTIAHGFLTLSLIPKFMEELFKIETMKMGINYGTNKVRFISPVPSDSRVRMKATLTELEEIKPNGMKLFIACVLELEGSEKPACVAEMISVLYEPV